MINLSQEHTRTRDLHVVSLLTFKKRLIQLIIKSLSKSLLIMASNAYYKHQCLLWHQMVHHYGSWFLLFSLYIGCSA